MSNTQLVEQLIAAIGDDPTRSGVLDTPKRVVKSWKELYEGYGQDPNQHIITFDNDNWSTDAPTNSVVGLTGIEFYSMCEHHMLPIMGTADIVYIPGEKIVGLSKMARVLDVYARRLQVQERIGQQTALAFMNNPDLKPYGVACRVKARHFCMCSRGVGKQNGEMVTEAMYGLFAESSVWQQRLQQFWG